MIRALLHVSLTFALVATISAAETGLVQRIAAFQGQFSESFESVTNTDLKDLMGGVASFGGNGGTSLTVQNGDYQNLWDQHAFDGSYFLGGSAGYGSLATVEIRFANPIGRFGGLFGHRVRPGVNSEGETEFVFYDTQNHEVGRDRVLIGSYPGSVAAHWQFAAKVKRITFSYIHPMADALTADLAPDDPPPTNDPPSTTNTPPTTTPPPDNKPPAEEPPASSEPPPSDSPATTFTISGVVSDGTNGVGGVRVKLRKQFAVTDENGRYEFTEIPGGDYKLHASALRSKVQPPIRKVRVESDVAGLDFVVKRRR
jgi:hypothetical protein